MSMAADNGLTPGPYSVRLPLPRDHHGAKEPVRTLRSAATPAATSTTTIKIISSILIPVSPGVRICSEETSGLSGGGDPKWSSCPYEASLLRRDFPLVDYHDFRMNARRYFEISQYLLKRPPAVCRPVRARRLLSWRPDAVTFAFNNIPVSGFDAGNP
jgi:hypothetical protein